MPTRANALAVMAKAPIVGATKTRLAPFLSAEQAAELACALLVDQLHHLSAIETADLYLAFSPSDAGDMMREFAPTPFELFSQADGDLGARMQNIFATLFAKGYKKIILIGGDLPPVPLLYFAQAFAYLDHSASRVVLGPSKDGGYYLVGMNQRLPVLFDNMTWSHDQVFTQTVSMLGALGVPFLQLPRWFDIDTPEDLQSLVLSELAGKHTSGLLRRLEVGKRLGADA